MSDTIGSPKAARDKDIFEGITGLLNGTMQHRPRSTGRIQLELSPNPIEFMESSKYLEGPTLHYPQFEVARDFFELLCPMCNDIERIQKQKDIPREDQILLQYGVCPQCGLEKYVNNAHFRNFNELIGVVGMRGGKSVLIAAMSAAIIHELLCVDNLQEKLGLVKNQEIDGAFVAASGEQAAETIYGHFRGFYDNSPWFQDYRRKLLDLEIADPELRRGDLYKQSDRIIHFRDKNIRIKSLTSNSGSIAGKTRIFAVIDELSRMDAGESKRSATEVYRVLKRSLLTIKAAVERLRKQNIHDVPDARMFCISSPMFEDDKSMQLLKSAEKADKMFSFHRTTWEFNPDIRKEDLADEYAADPVGAERDYGANPPGAENPLVQIPALVEICIDKNRGSTILTRERFFEETIDSHRFTYVAPQIIDLKYANLIDYVIHCDPGHKQDSFCLAIGHREVDTVIIDGAVECRPIVKNNRQGLEPRTVYFPAMTDLILEIAGKLSIRYISYDRWNSVEQMQRLRQHKILAFQRDINRDDYVRFLSAITSKSISFPTRESEIIDPTIGRNLPCAKALYELKRLNDNGVRVDHPPGGSSDMIQAYVGVYRLLMFPEEVLSVNEMKSKNRNVNRYKNRKLGKVIRLPPKGTRR
jgi:hypothetical protein